MKPVRPRAVLILAVGIISLFAYFYHKNPAGTAWQPVKKGPIVSAIYGLGTVTSDKVYHLKVTVPTHVKALLVHEGDDVHKDQPLVLLDGLPPFKAVFDGTVTSLPLNQNETVPPNTEVLTLMDLRDCYILVSLEQESAVKIRKGQKVKLNFSGLQDQTFNGIVTSVYPKNQESYVKIVVDKLPASILPQMSSDVAIVLEEKPEATLVPVTSVNNAKITIRRAGRTLQVPIQLGIMSEEYAEVISKNIYDTDLILVKT